MSTVTLTAPAADKLREVLATQPDRPGNAGLRVDVHHGGCSGFQYRLALDVPGDGDQVFEHDELRILVDASSLPYVEGSTIAFVDEPGRTGFVVDNPRAVATCGCGSSFVMADEAA